MTARPGCSKTKTQASRYRPTFPRPPRLQLNTPWHSPIPSSRTCPFRQCCCPRLPSSPLFAHRPKYKLNKAIADVLPLPLTQYLNEMLKNANVELQPALRYRWCTPWSSSQRLQSRPSQSSLHYQIIRFLVIHRGLVGRHRIPGISPSSLGREETLCRLNVGFVIVLLECCKSGSAVILGTAATLLIPEVLPSIRGEETCAIEA